MGVITNPAKRKEDMHDIEVREINWVSAHACVVKAERLDPDVPFDYKPGQWVYLIDAEDFREDKRAYSLASTPDMADLEFGLEIIPNGLFSPRIAEWKIGDRFTIRGPFGTFLLKEPIAQPLCLVGFNAGIVPLVSLLRQQLATHETLPVHVLFAATDADYLVFHEELGSLAAWNDHITYQPIPTGHLDPAQFTPDGSGTLREALTEFAFAYPDGLVYAAGLGAFIELVRRSLEQAGFSGAQLFSERYD